MNGRICILGDLDDRLASRLELGGCAITSAEEADIAVFGTILWNAPQTTAVLTQLEETGARIQKPILVFIVHDEDNDYGTFNWLILLRTSLRASLRLLNEMPLPYIWECRDRPWDVLPHHGNPILGFCGLVTPEREELLDLLETQPDFTTQFIRRNQFWGGQPNDPTLADVFNANIRRSHFVIAPRGAGNFSMRFYQTLASGRIPVLLDTDLCLPYDDEIDWENTVVISRSLERLPEIIRTISQGGQVERMQTECARIFEHYFRSFSIERIMADVMRGWSGQRRRPGYESTPCA